MANVTKSWTQLASATKSLSSGFSITYYLEARYTAQDIAANTTTRETRLRSVVNSGSASGSGYEFTLTDADTLSGSGVWTFKTETILTGSGDVSHNADGTKTETISASVSNDYWSGLNATLSGSATYPTIARASTVSCRESVSIGAMYTTITVNRASESFTHTLEIVVNDTVQETFTNVTDSYRWMPSAQIYNQLTRYSKYLDATIRCTTYSGNTQIGSPTTLAITLVVPYTYAPNVSNPTVNVPSPCLKGVSNVAISYQPSSVIPANSHATLVSYTVKVGNQTYNMRNLGTVIQYTIQKVTVNNATITMTDSRGYSSSYTVGWLLTPYVPVSVTGSYTRSSVTSGSISLTITGNYFTGAGYTNSLTLRVQGTNAGGTIDNTYTTGITFNQTKNTYTKTVTLTGFTYTEDYVLTLTATDNQGSATYTLTVSQSQPAFSVGKVNGKNHFDVHGDLRVVSTSDPSDGRSMNGFVFQTSWSSGTHDLDDAPNGLTWINWNNATVTSANTIPFNSGYGFLFQAGNRFQMYVKHGTAGIQGMWVRDYTTDTTSHWFAWVQIGGGSSPSYVNGDEVSY